MRSRNILLLLSIFPLYSALFGYETSVGVRVGYHQYKMTDFRKITETAVQQYTSHGIAVKEFGRFPPYFAYYIDYTYYGQNSNIGLVAGFSSTGSTIHYADYSGQLRDTYRLSRYQIGFLGENKLYVNTRFQILSTIELSASRTNFLNEYYLEIFGQDQKVNYSMKKWGCNIEPSICIRFTTPLYLFSAGIGYELDIFQQSYGQDKNGNNLYASWQGIITYLSLRYKL